MIFQANIVTTDSLRALVNHRLPILALRHLLAVYRLVDFEGLAVCETRVTCG
jgi:hypothetical protein